MIVIALSPSSTIAPCCSEGVSWLCVVVDGDSDSPVSLARASSRLYSRMGRISAGAVEYPWEGESCLDACGPACVIHVRDFEFTKSTFPFSVKSRA